MAHDSWRSDVMTLLCPKHVHSSLLNELSKCDAYDQNHFNKTSPIEPRVGRSHHVLAR